MSRLRAINRTQGLVLGFFAVVYLVLVVVLALSPAVRDTLVDRFPGAGARVVPGFLGGLLLFLAVLSVGVVRRWRWLFWLIVLAFAAGVARVPVAVLQLTGRITPEGPDWYVVVQGVIGLVQVAITATMIVDYRRSGVWGPR
jgi:hypothetical protein